MIAAGTVVIATTVGAALGDLADVLAATAAAGVIAAVAGTRQWLSEEHQTASVSTRSS